MKRHLALVDDASAVELAAMQKTFQTAVAKLGLLPDEVAALLRPVLTTDMHGEDRATALSSVISELAGIADDAFQLTADEDQVVEWLRSPNPGLWTDTLFRVQLSPVQVMLDYHDGLRAIRMQLASELARAARRMQKGYQSSKPRR